MSTRRKRPPGEPSPRISRRRFVSLLAAGSAALVGPPFGWCPPVRAAAAAAAAVAKPVAKKPAAPSAAYAAELERQRKGTLDVLKTIRAHELPPGGELSLVFRPLRRKGR